MPFRPRGKTGESSVLLPPGGAGAPVEGSKTKSRVLLPGSRCPGRRALRYASKIVSSSTLVWYGPTIRLAGRRQRHRRCLIPNLADSHPKLPQLHALPQRPAQFFAVNLLQLRQRPRRNRPHPALDLSQIRAGKIPLTPCHLILGQFTCQSQLYQKSEKFLLIRKHALIISILHNQS